MHKFKDFGIKVESKAFEGEKIKLDKVLNKEIMVHDFKVNESKFKEKGTGECLTLQITLNDDKRVFFTGSGSLRDMIKMVPKDGFPFCTTIVRENERLQFT